MTRVSDDLKNGQKWFDNAELKSDKHDEILIWLISRVKDKDFLPKLYPGLDLELVRVEIEHRIERGSFLKGFADLALIVNFKEQNYQQVIYFEVKSRVNIGETIRQIRYYDTDGPWFVCAPPFKNFEILQSQNIGFIPYGN